MGERERTRTVTDIIHFCERCGKEHPNQSSMKRCYVCGRECCFVCCRWTPMYTDSRRRMLELGFSVCEHCLKVDQAGQAAIVNLVDTANLAVIETFDAWCKAAKKADQDADTWHREAL